MPVGIFNNAQQSGRVSSNGAITNPIVFKFTQAGGTEERKLYLRHDVLSGETAESSTSVSVDPFDLATASGDQSTWIQVAADVAGVAGTYSAAGVAKNLGDVNLGQIVPFWIKATVPANTEVGARDDVTLRTTSTSNGLTKSVDLSAGTVTGCTFDGVNNRIAFAYNDASATGEFLSGWLDFILATAIRSASYTMSGGGAPIFSYRTATNSSGANPTAWYNDPASLDLTNDWVQIRIQFYATGITPATTGLTQYKYSGVNFDTFAGKAFGQVPYTGNPNGGTTGAPHSSKWIGSFNAATAGSYTFYISSDDGHRCYLDGVLLHANWTYGGGVVSQATTTLSAGYHTIEYNWFDGGGGSNIYAQVTPPSASQRAVVASDFLDDRLAANNIYISNLKIVYQGSTSEDFDIRFWNGPATPTLISPANGSNTDDFNPPLTAVTTNGDYINFQLDKVASFSSANLTNWEVPCVIDVNLTSQSPTFDRPSGVWYWRARSKLAGAYGNWADPWIVTINPFVGRNSYLYFNVNSGFEVVDTLLTNKYLYLNINVGAESDSIYRNRHVYLNLNVTIAVGEVIYPIFDRTPVRKQTFTEDGTAFI